MGFTSITFLFFLLPLSLMLYGLACLTNSIKIKNFVLIIISGIFYSWCGVQFLFLLMILIFINYVVIKLMSKSLYKKQWLAVAVLLNVLTLSFFKYTNFIVNNIENIICLVTKSNFSFHASIIPLPLGISFFVFQLISVLTDCYRDDYYEISFGELVLYIILFPQLVEGPIVRYKEVRNRLSSRVTTSENLLIGTKKFIVGFGKKVLIADYLSKFVDIIFQMTETGIPLGYAWLGIISYAFVIYYDFSGYSDMAIGLCKIFGFDIAENFNYPYISKSIQEFWRRWHISLSTWFRDYVYIPLGGNRQGMRKTYRNLMIVFLLTGIWHGANWTFIIWGIFHGVFMLLERLGLKDKLDKLPKIVGHLYSIIVILVGWVFFRADNVIQAAEYLKMMFIPADVCYLQISVLRMIDLQFVVIIILAFICATPFVKEILQKIEKTKFRGIIFLGYLILFFVSVSVVYSSSFSPSIYTKF